MVPRRLRQIVATTLAITLGIVAGVDIVGTPLAIVAIDHAQSASTHAKTASDEAKVFAVSLGKAVVKSRVDDCKGQERLRALGRKRLKQKERETPANLRLLHVQDGPQVEALLHRQYQEERTILARVDCRAYGRRDLP